MNHDNDTDLFRKACKNVIPLKKKARTTNAPPPRTNPPRLKNTAISEKTTRMIPLSEEPSEWHTADSRFSFSKAGLQRKLLSRLRSGKMSIEARLDLHRLTAAMAEQATLQFIDRCQQAGKRVALIIHGKGHYSKEQTPILKSYLLSWLTQHPGVLAAETAQARDGGTGAVYVLLKRESYD